MSPLRAAVLDFDGLILDTESAGYEALRRVFAARGAEYSLADYLPIVGTHFSVNDPRALLEARTGRRVEPAAFAADCRREETQLHAELAVLPGVPDLLGAARALGWRIGVASSSTHEWVDGFLHRLALHDRFDAIVCREDAARVKPAPDLYREALHRLGVPAEAAVAFEDSYNGSLAAKRAGLWCVAVPGPITRGQDFAHCDLVLASLAGLDLAALARRFAR